MEFRRREYKNLQKKGTVLSDTELLRKVMKVINCICVELKLESTEEFLKHENAKQKIKIV